MALTPIERWIRWGILAIAAVPIVIASLFGLGIQLPLPPCPIRAITGIPCPTCGMTRSFLAIVHGDLGHALSEHVFGPLLFLGFLGAIGHCLWELRLDRHVNTVYTRLVANQRWQIGLAIVVALYHVGRLYHWSRSGELQLAIANAPLTHWLKMY